MTLNLSALQQKQDQLIYTIDEIVEWMRKIAGQTGYAQLKYYDRNGNLVTKNVPTIGQLISQFQQGVNAQMQKTVYVDQVNGSDTSGDGSPSAPFKSIKKAVDSVPIGGDVSIALLSDYVMYGASEQAIVINKRIGVDLNNHTLTAKVWSNGSYNTLGYFLPLGSFNISFANGTLTIDESTADPNLTFDSFAQLIRKYSHSSGTVLLTNLTLNLPSNPAIAFMSGGREHSIEFISLKIYNSTVNASDTGAKLISGYQGYIGLFVALTTLNGATSWANILAGIVRDANGNPRNVISNLVL